MDIWIITVGEPLPMDDGDIRTYRSGLLFDELICAGHDVTWWTSSFDHSLKKHRTYGDKIYYSNNSKILLLEGSSYKKNISLSRIFNHRSLAKQFKSRIFNYNVPDVIICSFPVIELCSAAVQYANKNNIPIIIDVRDLWPDIFLDFVPRWSKYFVKPMLYKMLKDTEYIFKNSTNIFAVSDGYLNWALKKADRNPRFYDRVFPLGYPDKNKFKNKAKEVTKYLKSLGVDQSKKILLFIGSFGKTYDLSTVIEVARHYDNKNNNLQFVFCGDGDNYDQWTMQAKGVSNIIFTGWLDSNGINHLLNISTIGLAAYVKGAPQGLPNKLFEYMSTGLPILSSLEGETKELLKIENIGVNYESANINDLIKKIELLLDENTLKVLSINSLELFYKKFSAKTIYAKFRNQIEGLASTFDSKENKH